MPLHLLGKKSWNVYNADNIARVRRDEAAARAREEAAEQRMQEADAARRLAILRGEEPPPLPDPEELAPEDAYAVVPSGSSRVDRAARDRHGDVLEGLGGAGGGRERRKRKRPGEDDTDFEMRVVRERAAAGDRVREELTSSRGSQGPGKGGKAAAGDVDIVDAAGHIDLFGGQQQQQQQASSSTTARGEKNAEYEREAAQKRREAEDQYTMRFANAAGRDGGLASGAAPWYAKASKGDGEKKQGNGGAPGAEIDDMPSKDVWGNEDPGRRARAAARLDASDPLAMMKSGARKVREVEKERRKETEERERELKELRREERRREKRRRKEGRREDADDVDDLEGFSLDVPSRSGGQREKERDHHSEKRHRERSREGDKERRHRHDRSRHRDHREDGREERRRSDGRGSRHGHRSRDERHRHD